MQVYDIVLDSNRKEITRHGSFEFPLAVYTTQVRKNILGYIAWHWHEELQFCIVTEGIVDFHIRNDVVSLAKGEGIFINVGQMHKAKNHKGSDGSYICVGFKPSLLTGFLGSIIDTRYVSPYLAAEAPAYCILQGDQTWHISILNWLMEIHEIFALHEEGGELQIQILLLQIWQALVKDFFRVTSPIEANVWDPRIKVMMDYIHRHYTENIRLDALAAEVNLSKSACCRTFKKYVRCTVFEYLMDYRLTMSTGLLLTSDEPITSIAYRCGFGSTSYFIERFRMKSGVSPLVYRKENQGKKTES